MTCSFTVSGMWCNMSLYCFRDDVEHVPLLFQGCGEANRPVCGSERAPVPVEPDESGEELSV